MKEHQLTPMADGSAIGHWHRGSEKVRKREERPSDKQRLEEVSQLTRDLVRFDFCESTCDIHIHVWALPKTTRSGQNQCLSLISLFSFSSDAFLAPCDVIWDSRGHHCNLLSCMPCNTFLTGMSRMTDEDALTFYEEATHKCSRQSSRYKKKQTGTGNRDCQNRLSRKLSPESEPQEQLPKNRNCYCGTRNPPVS